VLRVLVLEQLLAEVQALQVEKLNLMIKLRRQVSVELC
jgi:hypothetical protein